MRDCWPNTRFSVAVSTCPGIRQGLDDGAFDVGLLLETSNRRTWANRPPTSATPYTDRRVVAPNVSLAVFGAHINSLVSLAARAPARRTELAAFTVLVSDADGDFHTLVERFFERAGVPGPRLQVIGSVEGVKKGVLADTRALGILPSTRSPRNFERDGSCDFPSGHRPRSCGSRPCCLDRVRVTPARTICSRGYSASSPRTRACAASDPRRGPSAEAQRLL